MKRFLNWKTALTGVMTALLLTGIAVVAYFAYCHHLDASFESVGISYKPDTLIEDENQTVTIVVEEGKEPSEYVIEGTPTLDQLRTLCGYHYVFYKELKNNQMAREGKEPYLRYQDLYFDDRPEPEIPENLGEDEKKTFLENYDQESTRIREMVESYLSFLEGQQFSQFNNNYDYWVTERGRMDTLLTNTDVRDIQQIDPYRYAFLFQVDYDEHGVPSISDRYCLAGDVGVLRKDLNSVLHEKKWQLLGNFREQEEIYDPSLRAAVEKACLIKNPSGCSVIIGMSKQKYFMTNEGQLMVGEWDVYFEQFARLSVKAFCLGILAIAAFSGLFYLNSRSQEKREKRLLARAPVELLAALVLLMKSAEYPLHRWMTALYLCYEQDYVSAAIFFFFQCIVAWYVGGCIGEIRIVGFKKYFEKRLLVLVVFRALGNHVKKLFAEYRSMNLGMDLRRKILRLVIINAIVVSLCCMGWFFGLIAVLIYSVGLYLMVMKYVIAVQKDYRELRRMTEEMAEGNLKYEPEKSLGLFEPAKEDLVQIRNGFDKAVREEVKSHKMKTELITNVSHDLKTPLTAIITYVNLLKEKNLTQEQIAQYVDTLDKKSLRLKRLIEDLFEVSKANSGNVQLNIRDCDLGNLIKQCFYEVEEKLEEKKLTTRLTMPEGKVMVGLDGEKTYRIYENLFNNIVKYAMAGTRVYVTMTEEPQRAIVTIKNITEAELYVPAEELTERFVRGDASRGSVEGSGLGLAIARSFTELQGGKFEIDVDGDLFKVTTIWRKSSESAE